MWQKQVQPVQTHVWVIEPHMDYLDEDNEVPNPGPVADPTYTQPLAPPGSSVLPEGEQDNRSANEQ